TLMIDNPQLNSRLNETIEKKIILIIDSALTLPAHLNIFDSAKHCHIFYNKTLNAPKKNRNCTYHALAANYDKKLNLEQLMHYIGQDLGFHDVWVEAGGQLFTALHLQNLVQKTYLYIVPTLLNEPATSGFCDSKLFDSPHTITWQAANDNMIACLEWDKSSIQTNTELNN
ncbi:MAG TPA: riboflavin biosynthesis protein RibD, partial [Legionellales bacterium]|nr:riboflavin biosynthesis protein RibD [Legionellales bacterium]